MCDRDHQPIARVDDMNVTICDDAIQPICIDSRQLGPIDEQRPSILALVQTAADIGSGLYAEVRWLSTPEVLALKMNQLEQALHHKQGDDLAAYIQTWIETTRNVLTERSLLP